MIEQLERCNKSVLAVTSTGIGETLSKTGWAAHIAFPLLRKWLNNETNSNTQADSVKGIALRNLDVMIWDEISTQTMFAVERVDRLLRDMAHPENEEFPSADVRVCLPREQNVLEWMYADAVVADPEEMKKMALLSVRYCFALVLNELVLQKVPGKTVKLTDTDTPVTDKDGVRDIPCEIDIPTSIQTMW
ncbi:hypothetical protein ANCCAN_06717 [Ancylostoma caninum]|uniref:ATP-dependent DNA helicase n=1 Tax=Ancylostoma caninum TaxID=29170 RepID=A0A368GW87_ANCCA|nr:hypothetical protein ANCCAN_06717 [Ancylostoma caninum]